MVQEYENLVNAIKTIHTICDDAIDWREINARKEPFDPNRIGPRQASAFKGSKITKKKRWIFRDQSCWAYKPVHDWSLFLCFMKVSKYFLVLWNPNIKHN